MDSIFNKMIRLYKAGYRQKHESTCGPASMILAGLGLGLPERKEQEWIHPKFSPWMPVKDFLDRGMALHELCFISELIYSNQLDIRMRRAYPENYSLFVKDLKDSFRNKQSVVIVNYRQDDLLKDTAPSIHKNPHYSPVVDLRQKDEGVLLCDIDAAVEDFYWVNIKKLFQSMEHNNPAFHLPRGWLVLRKRSD